MELKWSKLSWHVFFALANFDLGGDRLFRYLWRTIHYCLSYCVKWQKVEVFLLKSWLCKFVRILHVKCKVIFFLCKVCQYLSCLMRISEAPPLDEGAGMQMRLAKGPVHRHWLGYLSGQGLQWSLSGQQPKWTHGSTENRLPTCCAWARSTFNVTVEMVDGKAGRNRWALGDNTVFVWFDSRWGRGPLRRHSFHYYGTFNDFIL